MGLTHHEPPPDVYQGFRNDLYHESNHGFGIYCTLKIFHLVLSTKVLSKEI